MARFINPFTDTGFKRIFGQEISKELLLHFLNQLLYGERVIKDIKFLDKEQLPQVEDRRTIIYDVYCETDTGEHIIVEMQQKKQESFLKRSVYYLSNAVVQQGERGYEWKYDIDAVYGIFFMNFKDEHLEPKLRTDMILADRESGAQIIDTMRFIYLQLPYFNKKEAECESYFDKWLYVLMNMDTLERMPWAAQSAVFKKLAEIGDLRKLSREERIKYDRDIRNYRDWISTMDTAKNEGMQQGFEQGVQQGMQQGRKEQALSIALNLKSLGMSLADISKATGLSIEDIEQI